MMIPVTITTYITHTYSWDGNMFTITTNTPKIFVDMDFHCARGRHVTRCASTFGRSARRQILCFCRDWPGWNEMACGRQISPQNNHRTWRVKKWQPKMCWNGQIDHEITSISQPPGGHASAVPLWLGFVGNRLSCWPWQWPSKDPYRDHQW